MKRRTMTALVLVASSFALAAGGHSGGSDAEMARFSVFASGPAFLSVENAAQDGVVWDMNALKRLDFTNKAYEIANGRVDVDLISGTTQCPTGLGHLASGISTVNQICIRYQIARDGDYHLKVTWDPGGSGQEQFGVTSNGQGAGESEVVDGEKTPERRTISRFPLKLAKGPNELVLTRLSGDGLRFKNILLASGFPSKEEALAGEGRAEASSDEPPAPQLDDSGVDDGEDASAGPGKAIWDMNDLCRFDASGKTYAVDKGRVIVELASEDMLCPTGLGFIAEGRGEIRDIVARFEVAEGGVNWLHILWNPGENGKEQFEVLSNGNSAGKSRLADTAVTPLEDVASAFRVECAEGPNEIVLRYLSNDGLSFKRLALTTSRAPLEGQTVSLNLKWPTLATFSRECGEPGVVIDGEHVRMFAPKRRQNEARRVMEYVVKAYDELYRIVGAHTRYKVVVYNFPKGNPNGWGGTGIESCVIEYSEENLDLMNQSEWKSYGVPHVSGYIEEMAHDFAGTAGAKFGWESVGWSLGVKVSEKVAGNPIHKRSLEKTRGEQAETYKRYKALGNTYPRDLPYNTCDRIHAYVMWQCELAYGENFWRDLFAEVRKERDRLNARAAGSSEEDDNDRRCAITVDCFDRLKGVDFKKRLAQDGISATVYVRSLHPENPGWNRKLQ